MQAAHDPLRLAKAVLAANIPFSQLEPLSHSSDLPPLPKTERIKKPRSCVPRPGLFNIHAFKKNLERY
jgi:hypothetical protein